MVIPGLWEQFFRPLAAEDMGCIRTKVQRAPHIRSGNMRTDIWEQVIEWIQMAGSNHFEVEQNWMLLALSSHEGTVLSCNIETSSHYLCACNRYAES